MTTDDLPAIRRAVVAAADAAVGLLGAIDAPFCGELEEWVEAVEAAAKKMRSRANWVALELEDLR